MLKKRRFLSPILTALVLSVTLGAANVQAATVKRTDGGAGGRIGTANQVALDLFSKSQNVILVNGYGYADAVSATPLAKQLNAPILLTHGDALESEVASTISSLGATKVYIVGGTGVVSTDVENTLKDKYDVERIAGVTDSTRMGTNAEVAKKVLSMSNQKNAVLVNGQDGYADSLSVASIAAQKGYPVLFASKTQVAPVVKDVITSKGLTIQAVGGSGVLPQDVVASVSGTKVTSDADCANRFATNLAVLNYFENNGGLDFSNIYVAAGGAAEDQFADALVASAAAAKTGSPVVLTGLGAGQAQVIDANSYIFANAKDNSNVVIVGGTDVVSQDIQNTLQSTDDLQIIGIE
ncbi:cell wall-binding repeat-containing protein [Clostridium ljungdahlii]|uniref:N-acetylmuramoyl-L-alanine amidase LytC n=1 Tax=Clostridium ljungdahlii TaxID=1538 RepID=A0A168NTZ3_9CLOT|nr:cell wall-binding repeat-containing protein [Clostridium ljungdahlii]OAA86897.1 N-acetylmuramoyl-L-alanine amidase LytC precursor [Clostridium ljungdahlii]